MTGAMASGACVRPANLPRGRWHGDFDPPFTASELSLVAACAAGDVCVLGDGSRPVGEDDARKIRAEVVRFLLLGGDAVTPVHEAGVHLAGAHLVGALTLASSDMLASFGLSGCRLDAPPDLIDARVGVIRLHDCDLPGLRGAWMSARGSLCILNCSVTGRIDLQGAEIDGNLDFSNSTLANPGGEALDATSLTATGDFVLRNTRISGAVYARYIELAGTLDLQHAVLNDATALALDASGASVKGDVDMRGCHIVGEVSITGADIGGDLSCNSASLSNTGGDALSAYRITIRGALFLIECKFAGCLALSGSTIGDKISCHATQFHSPDKSAFNADTCAIKGDMFIRHCEYIGEFSMMGSEISGDLDIRKSKFENIETDSIRMHRSIIKGSFFLQDCEFAGAVRIATCNLGSDAEIMSCTITSRGGVALNADGLITRGALSFSQMSFGGVLSLIDAQIGGSVSIFQSSAGSANQIALNADRITVKGSMFIGETACGGMLRLLGATIGGNIECHDVSVGASDGALFCADGLDVHGDIRLRKFNSQSELSIIGSKVGGDILITDSHLATGYNSDGDCMTADGTSVAGDIFLTNCTFTGQTRMLGCSVGGDMSLSDVEFQNKNGYCLDLAGVSIKNSLMIQKIKQTGGAINLYGLRCETLADSVSAWRPGGYILDGLAYERFSERADAKSRIAWLKAQRRDQLRSSDFAPHPWEQTIRVLRTMGHQHEAAEVAIAKQEAMRKAGKIGRIRWPRPWWNLIALLLLPLGVIGALLVKIGHRTFGLLAAYGYKPQRLLVIMVLIWITGSAVCEWGIEHGRFAPTALDLTRPDSVYILKQHCGARSPQVPGHFWTEPGCTPEGYTLLQSAVYSADVILPVVSLGQRDAWAPVVTDGSGAPSPEGLALRWFLWFETAAGWIGSGVLVAVMGNLVKRD